LTPYNGAIAYPLTRHPAMRSLLLADGPAGGYGGCSLPGRALRCSSRSRYVRDERSRPGFAGW